MMSLRPAILIVLLGALVGSLGCKDPVEEKCASVCKFAQACAETTLNTKLFGKSQSDFIIHCEDGCARFQSEILPCYEEAGKSCRRTMQCLLQTGLGD